VDGTGVDRGLQVAWVTGEGDDPALMSGRLKRESERSTDQAGSDDADCT
jgi:hypothetical protein